MPRRGRGRNAPPAHRLFSLTARVSTRQFIAIATAVFLTLGLLWWGATAASWVTPLFLPSPNMVFERFRGLAANGLLFDDSRAWEATIEPLVDFVRDMPVVAFVPLAILWAGTGDAQKFLIVWIGTFFH